jgi:N-acetylglucosamine kinase-like BadF-type ATPase
MSAGIMSNSELQSSGYYVAGVDGGGTKTCCLITDNEYHVLGEAATDPSNPLRVGLDRTVQSVVGAIDAACAAVGIQRSDLAALGVGLGGVRHAHHHQATSSALRHALSSDAFVLVPDAEIALFGATGGEPGVVVIAGTGSVACGMNARGQITYSGGWGPAFGDEGSGYDIARRALMAAAADFDGRGRPTTLTSQICQWFNVSTPVGLLNILYRHNQPHDSPQIAPLAEIVVRAAEVGDEVAREILDEAGAELGRAANAVIQRLNLEQEPVRVAYVGSVFQAGDLILTPLRQTVVSVAPQARVTPPLYPPAIGAAMLAVRRQLVHDIEYTYI